MEQQPEQTMPEVSGHRSSVEMQRSQLTSMIVSAMTGTILGINLCQWILMKRSANYIEITTDITITLMLLSMGLLIWQWLKLRKWKHDLRAERQRLLETYSVRIDELLADDPLEAARIKMRMEEQWPRP